MKLVNRKTMTIRYSGRSSDYITPSFGFGCLYKCSYCYMRRHVPYGLTIAKNTSEIIEHIDKHLIGLQWPKDPNQTHRKYYTYDFSCNEDYIKHIKFHDWVELFDYFKYSKRAMGTAATKCVSKRLLSYNANRKIRIRFSLMPQDISYKLEPGTSKIIDRIKAINDFYEAGYDVHVNYSPVVMYEDHVDAYNNLFKLVNIIVDDEIKKNVKAESIFLTHNKKLHNYNISNNIGHEDLLWKPEIQESKTSQYGGKNIRYKHTYKREYINKFLFNHKSIIPWQKIRYIF
jgi:spore photoproduct lyase